MRALPKAPWWAIVIAALLLTDIVSHGLSFAEHRRSTQRFKIEDRRVKGGGNGTFIMEGNKPVYMEADLSGHGKIDTLALYWRGKSIMTLQIRDGVRDCGRMIEYYDQEGDEKLRLTDHEGNGEFHTRVHYGRGKPQMEAWFNGTWAAVEERDGKKGVVIDGQWQQLTYTNAAWSLLNGQR